MKTEITKLGISPDKIHPIPCFSKQYLSYVPTITDEQQQFADTFDPLLLTFSLFSPDYTLPIVLDCLKKVRETWPRAGLIHVGGVREDEDEACRKRHISQIDEMGLADAIFFTGDLDHDTFLTLVEKSHVIIRTPLSDGVSSSVIEAVSLGIPVVASKNADRPEGVITYEGGNGEDLYLKTEYALNNLETLRNALKLQYPENDTIHEEFELVLRTLGREDLID